MPKEYFIQILDGASDQIVYFDRIKVYRSAYRVITSSVPVKRYLTRETAEMDAELVKMYYHGQQLIEIIERELAEPASDNCVF